MPDRSFLERWSLDFDDAGFVEGFILDSRIWVGFQLRLVRTHWGSTTRSGCWKMTRGSVC